MSDQTFADVNVEFLDTVSTTEDMVRQTVNVDRVKSTLKDNEDALWPKWLEKYRDILVEIVQKSGLPEPECHAEAFSYFEGEMETAKASLIRQGYYTSSDFHSKSTFMQYMRDFKRASEERVAVHAVTDDGVFRIQSRGALNKAAKAAKEEREAAEKAARAKRRAAGGLHLESISGGADAEGSETNLPPEIAASVNRMKEIIDVVAEQGDAKRLAQFQTFMEQVIIDKMESFVKNTMKIGLEHAQQAAKTGTEG